MGRRLPAVLNEWIRRMGRSKSLLCGMGEVEVVDGENDCGEEMWWGGEGGC